jgi:antitoxin CptB
MSVDDSIPDEARRRRLLFRAWHRGTREMDLLLGRFTEKHLAGLNEAEIETLEQLMEAPEPDIYYWIIGKVPTPAAYDTPLMRRIREFHLGEGAS